MKGLVLEDSQQPASVTNTWGFCKGRKNRISIVRVYRGLARNTTAESMKTTSPTFYLYDWSVMAKASRKTGNLRTFGGVRQAVRSHIAKHHGRSGTSKGSVNFSTTLPVWLNNDKRASQHMKREPVEGDRLELG